MIVKDLKALAARSPEVRSYNKDRLEIYATPRTIEKLRELKIFFGRSQNRFKPTDIITIPTSVKLEPYACFPVGFNLVDMGAFSYSESVLPHGVKVGRYCSIAAGLQILRDRHPMDWVTTSSITYDFGERTGYRSFVAAQNDFNDNEFIAQRPSDLLAAPPLIEHDVWIGQNVQLARGIRVGTGSVIGAGALVTRDVQPYEVVGGIPARRIRSRFPAQIAEDLLATRWWECDPSVLSNVGLKDPAEFVRIFRSAPPHPFIPAPVTVEDILSKLDI